MIPRDLASRLATGQPPLRVSELSRITGYSVEYWRKVMGSGMVVTVQAPGSRERRMPVQEAVVVAKALRLID